MGKFIIGIGSGGYGGQEVSWSAICKLEKQESWWNNSVLASKVTYHHSPILFIETVISLSDSSGIGGAGRQGHIVQWEKQQIIWGSYFKTIILELAIYNRKLLHLPYLECFLFS